MLLLHHGKIRTMLTSQPLTEALAVQDGHILAVGTNEEILNLSGRNTTILDLHGRCVLPGLTDSHIHLLQYGLKLSSIDCETDTKQECLQRVAAVARHTPAGVWIRGQGWNHNLWEEGIGTKQELDAISTDHPIYLAAKSLHASWANSMALQQAGITHDTPDPAGGKIDRDSYGEPTGILLESATLLVEQIIPQPDEKQMQSALQKSQEQLLHFGITAVHDVDDWKIYPLLEEMKKEGKFPLRVVKCIPADHLSYAIKNGFYTGSGNDQLQIGWAKLFMDGALGPQTAAMLAPYEGSSESKGMLVLSVNELKETIKLATASHISLAIHAIGDRAVRCALDGITRINVKTDIPHRIEHVQIIDPADIRRMAALNVVASMQPIHAISDMDIADRYWGKRCEHAYAWNSVWSAGISLIFGSDAPVESPNPFWGMHAAVARCHAKTQRAWFPQQAISLQSALEAYTCIPAGILNKNSSLGTFSKGASADLVILPVDPFEPPIELLRDVQPSATMIGGEFIWKDASFFL